MVITFYSFKGGVGRSMALANVGEILANQGYRVVMVDWDVEAPGLEQYFADGTEGPKFLEACRASMGVMDLLQEYKQVVRSPVQEESSGAPASPPPSHSQVGKLWLRKPSSCANLVAGPRPGVGRLSLLTAGKRSGDAVHSYAQAVRTFDWSEFYERWAGDAYIDFFRKDLVGDPRKRVEGDADILLVDSRTGVTEQGGICTHHLADVVVLASGVNAANLEWTDWMSRNLTRDALLKMRGGRPLVVLPVAARVEQTAQKNELADFRREFAIRYRELILASGAGDPEPFALASEIPYVPFYSFKERIVAREEERERDAKLYQAYFALAHGLIQCGVRAGILREPSAAGRATTSEPPRAQPPGFKWEPEKIKARLVDAATAMDRAAVEKIAEEIIAGLEKSDEPYPQAEVSQTLDILRRRRYPDLVIRVAEALIAAGQNTAAVRRRYATALMDVGNIQAALSTLQVLEAETKTNPREYAEVRLLTARAYKLLYISASDRGSRLAARNLELAVSAYYEVYRIDPQHTWAGVSVSALLLRARRDRLLVEGFPDPRGIASEVLARIASQTDPPAWDLATATEACLVLEDYQRAYDYARKYLESPNVDAFNISSTLRNFTEVWQFTAGDGPGATLLPLLRSALLKLEGGGITIDPGEVRPRESKRGPLPVEGTFAPPTMLPLRWYQTGLERCSGIARIGSGGGSVFGTGFLVRGSDLSPNFSEELLVMTAAHVVGDEGARNALRESDALLQFEALNERATYKIRTIAWASPVQKLDVSLLRLDPLLRFDGHFYPIARELPAPGARVYLIGYGGGRSISFSLNDTLLLDHEPPFIHYRAPAEPGSSGSPLFDENWNLIGVHHAASPEMRRLHGQEGTYAACEAISIFDIMRAMAPRAPAAGA